MSFRQKLFASYFAVSIFFLALIYPLTGVIVRHIVIRSLTKQTSQVVDVVKDAPNLEAMKARLEALQSILFFRVTLFNSQGGVLYDSREVPVEGTADLDYGEVEEALSEGEGYNEHYSALLGQDLALVAVSFPYQGETLVLRTAFPLSQVNHLIDDFKIGTLTIGTALLLLFALMTTLVTHHFTRPIKAIIGAISPYQEGRVEALPWIELPYRSSRKDEFSRLAKTLNSLSERIDAQISTLRSERNERAAILESLVEGVVAVDSELKLIYANAAALRFLGIEAEGYVGNRFPSGQTELLNLLAASRKKGELLQETIQVGETPPTFFDAIAVPQGDEDGALLILQDQTKHYALLEMRKDFIANASHELKTPLTIIHGFAETLHEQPEMGCDLIRTVTEKILRNCQRMEQLVKNLLRLADIEHLPLATLERVDLRSFLEECRAMTLSIYPGSQVDLEIPEGKVDLWADAELLELAVTNLFYNAAKYSKPPAQIRVKVTLRPEKDAIQIDVSDRGIGIPEEDLPHIFQRFYTVDKAHSRQLGGSGLGLSIVETIVQKHYGEISVRSKLGEGTTFTLLFPRELNKLLG